MATDNYDKENIITISKEKYQAMKKHANPKENQNIKKTVSGMKKIKEISMNGIKIKI